MSTSRMSTSLTPNAPTAPSEEVLLQNLQRSPTSSTTLNRSGTWKTPPVSNQQEPSLRPQSSLYPPVCRGTGSTSSLSVEAPANTSTSALLPSTSLPLQATEATVPQEVEFVHEIRTEGSVRPQEIEQTVPQGIDVDDAHIQPEIIVQYREIPSQPQRSESSLSRHQTTRREEPPGSSSHSSGGQQETPPTLKQWKSWKTDWPYLSLLFTITISIILTVGVLDWASRTGSGFLSLGSPPSFLSKRPALEKALWSQGILYTSFPAFLITIYSMLFSSSVTKFVELQPYVDLAKPGGASAKTTIMLDYQTYPILYRFIVAFRNKHILLSLYMLLSLSLTIAVVPLTAFLFTDATFNFNATTPMSFGTTFNETVVVEIPDFQLPMDLAAAFRIFGGTPPPWTDGEYAFPRAVLLSSNQEQVREGNLTVETDAYSAYIDCREVPREEYNFTLVDPIDQPIPSPMYQISSNDRGCLVSNNFKVQLKAPLPGEDINNLIVKSWATAGCPADVGFGRLTIASGYYIQSTKDLTNFSLISCIPSYWTTRGILSLSMSGPSSSPTIHSFSEYKDKTSITRPQVLSLYFEKTLQDLATYNPTTNIDANDFGRHLYVLASQSHPQSRFLPQAISDAAQLLFTSIYAVFVSTTILQTTSDVVNTTAIWTTKETRLVIVSPVAYIIIGILSCVSLVILTMFWYGRKPHILLEEPAGLLSYVAIAHRSNLSDLVDERTSQPAYDGKLVKQLEDEKILNNTICKRAAYLMGSPIVLDRNPQRPQVVPTTSPLSQLRGIWS